jgi:hypothetical protein
MSDVKSKNVDTTDESREEKISELREEKKTKIRGN